MKIWAAYPVLRLYASAENGLQGTAAPGAAKPVFHRAGHFSLLFPTAQIFLLNPNGLMYKPLFPIGNREALSQDCVRLGNTFQFASHTSTLPEWSIPFLKTYSQIHFIQPVPLGTKYW
jgi:hypothetical protein